MQSAQPYLHVHYPSWQGVQMPANIMAPVWFATGRIVSLHTLVNTHRCVQNIYWRWRHVSFVTKKLPVFGIFWANDKCFVSICMCNYVSHVVHTNSVSLWCMFMYMCPCSFVASWEQGYICNVCGHIINFVWTWNCNNSVHAGARMCTQAFDNSSQRISLCMVTHASMAYYFIRMKLHSL